MSNALDGMLQGPRGMLQGPIGALVGETMGAEEGINRAAGRKGPMGLFSFLAPLASAIPGFGPLIGAGLSAIGGLQDQSAANRAAQSAQLAEAQGLGLSTEAARKLMNPDYTGILNAERSGYETFKANEGGANPGAAAKDIAGNNLTNAVAGVQSQRQDALSRAGGLYQGAAGGYSGIASGAAQAANTGGNPFNLFTQALQGIKQSPGGGGSMGSTPVTATAPQAGFGNYGTQAVDQNVQSNIAPNLPMGLPGAKTGVPNLTPIQNYQGPNF